MENTDKEQTQGETPENRTAEYIRKAVVYLLAVGIIVAALMFASSNSPDKSVLGFRFYTVLTPSMEPAYSVGDMVVVKVTGAGRINVGDVITFNPSSDGEAHLTHRVVEKLENFQGTGVTCFRTKGDANNAADSFVIDEGRVIGVVQFGIPALGYIVRFVQLRWYFVVPLVILLFIFFRLLRVYFAPPEQENNKEIPGETIPAEESKPQTDGSPTDDPPN